jgi:hypothetical protein
MRYRSAFLWIFSARRLGWRIGDEGTILVLACVLMYEGLTAAPRFILVRSGADGRDD